LCCAAPSGATSCLVCVSCLSSSIPFILLFFFFHCSGAPRALHSFPTRRSSDLGSDDRPPPRAKPDSKIQLWDTSTGKPLHTLPRSEEHTSDLQSLTNLVCRLLLEKNKKTTTQKHTTHNHTTAHSSTRGRYA